MIGIDDIGLKELFPSFITKGYEAIINSEYFQKKSIEKNYTKVELGFLYEHFFDENGFQTITRRFECENFEPGLSGSFEYVNNENVIENLGPILVKQ